MTPIRIGTVLVEAHPFMKRVLGSHLEAYSGNWSVVQSLNGFTLERKIRAAGWNCFLLAGESKASALGSIQDDSVRAALQRLLSRLDSHDFNCLEITGVVAKHFLGIPYITISAHSRHIQPGSMLDQARNRRAIKVAAEAAGH